MVVTNGQTDITRYD